MPRSAPLADAFSDAIRDHARAGYLTGAEAERLAECKRGGRRRPVPWTDEDRAKLTRWYPFLSARECAYVLGRSYGSVRAQAADMGLAHDARKRAVWCKAIRSV